MLKLNILVLLVHIIAARTSVVTESFRVVAISSLASRVNYIQLNWLLNRFKA